jgi:hypothetical protein
MAPLRLGNAIPHLAETDGPVEAEADPLHRVTDFGALGRLAVAIALVAVSARGAGVAGGEGAALPSRAAYVLPATANVGALFVGYGTLAGEVTGDFAGPVVVDFDGFTAGQAGIFIGLAVLAAHRGVDAGALAGIGRGTRARAVLQGVDASAGGRALIVVGLAVVTAYGGEDVGALAVGRVTGSEPLDFDPRTGCHAIVAIGLAIGSTHGGFHGGTGAATVSIEAGAIAGTIGIHSAHGLGHLHAEAVLTGCALCARAVGAARHRTTDTGGTALVVEDRRFPWDAQHITLATDRRLFGGGTGTVGALGAVGASGVGITGPWGTAAGWASPVIDDLGLPGRALDRTGGAENGLVIGDAGAVEALSAIGAGRLGATGESHALTGTAAVLSHCRRLPRGALFGAADGRAVLFGVDHTASQEAGDDDGQDN